MSEERKLLMLIKMDSENLFDRLKNWSHDYIQTMAVKRSREHFKDVFQSRFDSVSFNDLKHLDEKIIVHLNEFYKEIDQLKWYLNHTEDMTATVEDHVARSLKVLEQSYIPMQSEIDLQIGNLPSASAEDDGEFVNFMQDELPDTPDHRDN